MGRVVAELVKNETGCKVVGGIDPGMPELEFPVYPSCEACNAEADVIIDFSTATAIPALLDFACSKKSLWFSAQLLFPMKPFSECRKPRRKRLF